MLMSDTWQPSVLQLLPFSSNNASHIQPPATPSGFRSLPLPDHSRGFPVLAVTRRENDVDTPSPKGRGGKFHGAGLAPSRARAVSERMTRSQTFVESASFTNNPRAKSEYLRRQSRISTAYRTSRSNGGGGGGSLEAREQVTCSVNDLNERITPRVAFRADSVSPDSSSGSLRNSPYVTQLGSHATNGGNPQSLPKPSFPNNALSPNNSSAAFVIGSANGNGVGDGRPMGNKNGMWRSMTLTPGEMELKKHRDILDRISASTVELKGGGGRQYHKMNIRDLPRSTTPVNDHDPDKLNMKQVIAFLQSKGKSQADAVELPRGMKGKVTHSVTFPRAVQSGVMRGSVRKAVASSTSAEILMKSSRRSLPTSTESRDAFSSLHRVENGDVARSSYTSMPSSGTVTTERTTARAVTLKSSGSGRDSRESRDGREGRENREHKDRKERSSSDRHDYHAESSKRRFQKKPFRLHRFLTMVPTARDSNTAPLTCPVNQTEVSPFSQDGYPSSRTSHKERSVCLDLATQSKAQTQQSKGECAEAKPHGKIHYRLTAARSRPSSLHVEQDTRETQSKLSADFGDRGSVDRQAGVLVGSGGNGTKETKNVIRLPFVMVDSEDEDTGLPTEQRKPNLRTKTPKHRNHTKPSLNKTQVSKDPAKKETAVIDAEWAWTEDVKENHTFKYSSQASSSSPVLPHPQTFSTSSLVTASLVSEPVSDITQDSLDDRLPEVGSDPRLIKAVSENGQGQARTNSGKTAGSKTVKVNIPSQRDFTKHGDDVAKSKPTDCVTLTLRKERHRTRERTYMSEIAGSDMFSDDTCAARVNSESVRMSLRSDDTASWAS